MISYERARRIGVEACIDKLGREFVMKHRDSSGSAYGDRGDHAYCFVGVDDKPVMKMDKGLMLTSDSHFPFVARCTVRYSDGKIDFLECVLPDNSAL